MLWGTGAKRPASTKNRLTPLRASEASERKDHAAVRRQHDVGGLEVPVDDPLLVSLLERLRNLDGNMDSLTDRDGTARNARRQRLPRNELEDEVVGPLRLLQPVNGSNPGMVQRCENLRLSLETGQPLGVLGELGRQDFDRHASAELFIPGSIHLSHTTFSNGLKNLVVSELLTGG